MSEITIPLDVLRQKLLAKSKPAKNGCRIWTKAKQTNGYGSVGIGASKSMLAHRAAYVAFIGPIPDGMTVDHQCHNKARALGLCAGGRTCQHRLCIDRDHIEAVSAAMNNWRANSWMAWSFYKTHCPQGHEYGEAPPMTLGSHRTCATCAAMTDEEIAELFERQAAALREAG